MAQWHTGSVVIIEPNLSSLPVTLQQTNVSQLDLASALGQTQLYVQLVQHKEFVNLEHQLTGNQLLITASAPKE